MAPFPFLCIVLFLIVTYLRSDSQFFTTVFVESIRNIINQAWYWASHKSYAVSELDFVCHFLVAFIFSFDWYRIICTALYFLRSTQTAIETLLSPLWLWSGNHNYSHYETPQEFILAFCISDYKYYVQSPDISLVMAMTSNLTIVLIFIKLFIKFLFPHVAKFVFVCLFVRGSISFFHDWLVLLHTL